MLVAALVLGGFVPPPDGPIGPDEKKPCEPAPGDTARVIMRADFEKDTDSFHEERWEEYKPWNVVEHETRSPFRNSSGALKTTSPNYWNCLGPVKDVTYEDERTKVCFAYRGVHCRSVTAQAWSLDADKNLHEVVRGYEDGKWKVGQAYFERFVPWGGDTVGKGHAYRTIMIYAAADKSYSDWAFCLDDVVIYSGVELSPPAPPWGFQARGDGERGEAALSWSCPDDNVAVAHFHVYRSLSPEAAGTLLGRTCEIEFRDDSLSNFGTYYYHVVAEDFAGNRSKPSVPYRLTVMEAKE